MSDSSIAELYFIIGMMVLILIICVAATYIFFRQYKRERPNTDESDTSAESKSPNQK